jgi:hypothetical protein
LFLPLFEAEGLVAGFQDVAVMGDAIEQGGRHLGIAEHCELPLISNG